MGIFAGLLEGAADQVTKQSNDARKQSDTLDQYRAESLQRLSVDDELAKRADARKQANEQAKEQRQRADADRAYKLASSPFSGPTTDLQPGVGKQFDLVSPDINNSNSTPANPSGNSGNLAASVFGNPSAGSVAPTAVTSPASNPSSNLTQAQATGSNTSPDGMPDNAGRSYSGPAPQAGPQPDFMTPVQPTHFAQAQQAQQVASTMEASGIAESNPFAKAKIDSLKTEAEMHYKAHEDEQKELDRNAKPLEGADGQKLDETFTKDYTASIKTGNTQYNPRATIDGHQVELKQPLTQPTPDGKEAGEVDQHIHDTIATPLMQASAAAKKGNGTTTIDTVYSTLKDRVTDATKDIVTFNSEDPRVTETDKHEAATKFAGYIKDTFGNSLPMRLQNDPNLQEVLNPQTMANFNSAFHGKSQAGTIQPSTDTTRQQYDSLAKGATYTVGGTTYTKK